MYARHYGYCAADGRVQVQFLAIMQHAAVSINSL
jgi:hypothetical protein